MQPDGMALTITLKGDEFVSWAESSDGYTLLRNSSGFWEYAQTNVQGDLALSGRVARNVQQRTAEDNDFLSQVPLRLGYSTSQAQVFHQLREMRQQALDNTQQLAPSQPGAKPEHAPVTGTIRLPVILVQFPGKPFTKTKSDFEMLFNQVGYSLGTATGSVRDYFLATSYNQLTIQFDVYGPYTLANPIAYYDYDSNGNNSAKTTSIVVEATTLAQGGGCNFANYDRDADGKVDGIHLIFAGYDQSAGAPVGDAIWATAWSTTGSFCTRDGKTVPRFSMSSELRNTSGTTITSIGASCHEISHVFGLPDLYDTDYAGSGGTSVHIDRWCLMASGSWNNNGDTPPYHMAWCRDKMGWVPTVELTSSADVTIPNPALQGASYKITTTTPNEYFLLENRQRQNWDLYIPASGLLIYHVDENAGSHTVLGWRNINVNPSHRGLYVKQAGGGAGSTSTNRTTDPYPQGANNLFTDVSVPNSKSWAGNSTAKPVTDIVHNTGTKTITFKFMGGTVSDVTPPVPGSSGTITTANLTHNSLTLNWTKATDNVSAQTALKYYVYQKSSAFTMSGGLPTDGTLLNSGGTLDIETYPVSSLTPSTTYYFIVVVEDEAGNKAAYTAVNLTTPAPPTLEALTVNLTADHNKVTVQPQAAAAGHAFYYSSSMTKATIPAHGVQIGTVTGATLFTQAVDISGANGSVIYVQVYKVATVGNTIVGFGEESVKIGKVGDINGDSDVNYADLSLLLGNYGKSGAAISPAAADINGDDDVNYADLSILLGNYGK